MQTMENKEVLEQMKENNKMVRKMVLDSYQDMVEGKGRDYKEFFAEMESRYTSAQPV